MSTAVRTPTPLFTQLRSELCLGELRRILLLGTSVNRGLEEGLECSSQAPLIYYRLGLF